MKQHRVAIVGTGGAVKSHLEALAAAGERVAVVAAVDIVESRVRAVCEEAGIPRWYTDTERMLAQERPDLVHIVTPPGTHFELILACLGAGAWVYCEKPLCASLAQFDRISQAEGESGGYVSTVFQWRFGSAARHVKWLMENGELGRPLLGICHTLWYRGLPYYEVPWRGKWATDLGGPTVTLGIHLMDLFLWLMGDWQEVWGRAETLERPIEVEDVSLAQVRLENGALASMVNSALSPRQESYLRLDFQRATVEVSALYRYTNANWRFSLPDGSPDGAELARWQAIETDVMGSHGVQLAELLDSMDRGERPFVSGAEARRIIEFISSLYKSAATGRPVRRGEIGPGDPFYGSFVGSET
jgi:predicted dehydrogenase